MVLKNGNTVTKWGTWNSNSFLKTFVDFNVIPMHLAIILLMHMTGADHLSLLLIMTPRKCIPFTACILVWLRKYDLDNEINIAWHEKNGMKFGNVYR